MSIENPIESGLQNESLPDFPETEKIREEFQGQDVEVSVKRTGGSLEGGWEVVGPGRTEDEVQVGDRKYGNTKFVRIEDLKTWQPFKVGDSTPIIRSSGNIDGEGWKVSKVLGNGNYMVEKTEKGRNVEKILKKEHLVEAKIAELTLRRLNITGWGQIGKAEKIVLNQIDNDREYWEDKLNTIVRLEEEDKKSQ